MGEELETLPQLGDWQFIPSHLTKGLIAMGAALVCAAYAVHEFRQVDSDEVIAMIIGH